MTSISLAALKGKTVQEVCELIHQAESLPENNYGPKGCGKKTQVGYNKVLDCPISNQCGMTTIGSEVFLCETCKSKPENHSPVHDGVCGINCSECDDSNKNQTAQDLLEEIENEK